MNDEDRTRLRIPVDWVIVDALGAILAGAGAYGLLSGPGGPLPLLAVPGVAWLCIAVGVGLMVLALTQILKRIVRQRAR
jgi:hypothetical protein